MNLVRIAARVAADPVAVPGGGGGSMNVGGYIDIEAIRNTLENALDSLDMNEVAAQGTILLEGFEPWDTIWKDHGIGILVTVADGEAGVSVQTEGESDLVYKAPIAQFDPAGASQKAIAVLDIPARVAATSVAVPGGGGGSMAKFVAPEPGMGLDGKSFDTRGLDDALTGVLRQARFGGFSKKEILEHVEYLWDENVEDHFDEAAIKAWSDSHAQRPAE